MTNTASQAATVKFSPAQEAIILEVAAAHGGVLNGDIVKAELCTRADMREAGSNEDRGFRSIVGKVSQMERSGSPFKYVKAAPKTKDGRPVTRKVDLVASIADAVGLAASKLNGMETSPKSALESLLEAIEDAQQAA